MSNQVPISAAFTSAVVLSKNRTATQTNHSRRSGNAAPIENFKRATQPPPSSRPKAKNLARFM